jgi:Glycosyltransferase
MTDKIGFLITSTGWGGLELNVLRLAGWLNERGWKVTLYALKDSKIYANAKDYPVMLESIDNHRKYFDFKAAFRFGKKLKESVIDRIMIFDNRDLDFMFLTKRILSNKIKLIYQQHMLVGVSKRDWLHSLRFSAIDYWISPLDLLKKEVMAKTNLEPSKIKVIPLGTETEKFVKAKYSKEEARLKLNIETKAPLIGIMGRIDPKKGQLFLTKAVNELKKVGVNAELLVLGEPTVNDPEAGIYYSELIDFIAANNLSEKIHLRGFTNDVSMFYNAIDVFALASHGETYGMVTIEAMLSQIPIIATNSAGTPEILNFGELGELYEYENLDDFCSKLMKILQHPDESREIAIKAGTQAQTRFSHITESEQIEKLLIA